MKYFCFFILFCILSSFFITLNSPVLAQSNCTPHPNGDANGDGKATISDFELWRGNDQKADFNCLNGVNNEDFNIWKRNYSGLTLTVCPTGTAGQNGCDFIGGDGIQQAVDSAPIGTSENKTTILIKSGNYTRQNFSEFIRPSGEKRKCFLETKEKNLIIKGENNSILDGQNSQNMSGICSKKEEVEVLKISITGFKRDSNECFQNPNNICSSGIGVITYGSAKLIFKNNILSYNKHGITLYDQSSGFINNNLIFNNLNLGIYFYNSSQDNNSEVINNVLYQNNSEKIAYDQINVYLKSNVTITNNIISNGQRGGIFKETNDPNKHIGSLIIRFNNVFNNSYGNYLGLDDKKGINGNISENPNFINPDNFNFHLQANSPSKNTGDPSILNPDGSRSDMGAYGGPNACGLDSTLPGC